MFTDTLHYTYNIWKTVIEEYNETVGVMLYFILFFFK